VADHDHPKTSYNPIFETLVKTGRGDILGLVAYGIYKISKREWVQEFQERHRRSPDAPELAAYISMWTPSQLENLRGAAEEVVASYADEVVEAAKPDIVRDALRGTTWRAVWTSMLASLLYTLLLIGLVFALSFVGIDIVDIAERVFGTGGGQSGGP